jgi:hypothetical protein
MSDLNPNELISELLDAWCERRNYALLRSVLTVWPHNGLTDGIAELVQALKGIRRSDLMTECERDKINQAIGSYSSALNDR